MPSITEFIQTYYINPVIQGTGYNIYNTLTYGAIFAVMVFLIYKFLQKRINIDEKFFIGVIPYIALGSILRVLEDANIFNSPLFITPLVFFVVFIVAAVSLWISTAIKKDYYRIWFATGAVICAIFSSFMFVKNPGALMVIVIFAFWVSAVYIARELGFNLLKKENAWVFLSHIFDATTTFVAIQFFPYTEQHVVAGFVIASLGPWSMYLLKIPVVLAVLWAVDKDVTNKQQNMFIKFAIVVLGLGPGLRNFLRLLMGV